MNLTPSQQHVFWNKWNTIVSLAAWTRPEAEAERHALLKRAGFASLKDVDKLTGFDRVLAELSAIDHPDDLDAQLREVNMPRTRLIFAVGKLSADMSPSRAPHAYACAISKDKFGTADIESLTDRQLLDLRNTLAARLCVHRRRQRQNPNSGQQLAA
jgi:hypothetical protein